MTTIRGTFCRDVIPFHAIFVCVFVSLTWLGGCANSDSGTLEGVQFIERIPTKVNVFLPTKVGNARKTASYFGTLKANRKRNIGFPVAGKIASLPQSQQRFNSGDPIAKLDSIQLDLQRESVVRELNATVSTADSAEKTRQLRARLADLDARILQQTILAPFDCIVEQVFAFENSLTAANSPIVLILETTSPKIEISVPKRIAREIEKAQAYDFDLNRETIQAVLRERPFSESPGGTVRLVFDIRSSLDDVDFFLDQLVEAKFSFPTNQPGYWLPMNCLAQDTNGRWSVLTVEPIRETSTVSQVSVDVAQVRDDSVLVTTDLQDKLIIRNGIHRVVVGQTVEFQLPADDVNASTTDATE